MVKKVILKHDEYQAIKIKITILVKKKHHV